VLNCEQSLPLICFHQKTATPLETSWYWSQLFLKDLSLLLHRLLQGPGDKRFGRVGSLKPLPPFARDHQTEHLKVILQCSVYIVRLLERINPRTASGDPHKGQQRMSGVSLYLLAPLRQVLERIVHNATGSLELQASENT
jgi:hypothetical protein